MTFFCKKAALALNDAIKHNVTVSKTLEPAVDTEFYFLLFSFHYTVFDI